MLNNKKTLILGASENPERYSNKAYYKLTQHGYAVELLGKAVGKIESHSIQTGFPKLENIDTITLYLNPSNQEKYYEYLLSLNPKRIIFNPGTENMVFEKMAKEKGIETLQACTLVLLSIGAY